MSSIAWFEFGVFGLIGLVGLNGMFGLNGLLSWIVWSFVGFLPPARALTGLHNLATSCLRPLSLPCTKVSKPQIVEYCPAASGSRRPRDATSQPGASNPLCRGEWEEWTPSPAARPVTCRNDIAYSISFERILIVLTRNRSAALPLSGSPPPISSETILSPTRWAEWIPLRGFQSAVCGIFGSRQLPSLLPLPRFLCRT